jgi:hypothetical protein
MDFDKILNTFIENKLRKAEVKKTSDNFTQLLMQRVNTESKEALEEGKRDRIAKYIIGAFSFLAIIFTVLTGILGTSQSSKSSVSKNISFEPAIDTSSNYFWRFWDTISSFFTKIFDALGLSISIETLSIIGGLILVVTLFFLADRIFLRGKLKSQQG